MFTIAFHDNCFYLCKFVGYTESKLENAAVSAIYPYNEFVYDYVRNSGRAMDDCMELAVCPQINQSATKWQPGMVGVGSVSDGNLNITFQTIFPALQLTLDNKTDKKVSKIELGVYSKYTKSGETIVRDTTFVLGYDMEKFTEYMAGLASLEQPDAADALNLGVLDTKITLTDCDKVTDGVYYFYFMDTESSGRNCSETGVVLNFFDAAGDKIVPADTTKFNNDFEFDNRKLYKLSRTITTPPRSRLNSRIERENTRNEPAPTILRRLVRFCINRGCICIIK